MKEGRREEGRKEVMKEGKKEGKKEGRKEVSKEERQEGKIEGWAGMLCLNGSGVGVACLERMLHVREHGREWCFNLTYPPTHPIQRGVVLL